MSKTAHRKYLMNWRLRAQVVDATVDDPSINYYPDQTGIRKADLVEVMATIGIDAPEGVETLADLTLEELYRITADELGLEPPETAGQDWGFRRNHLKALHRRAVDE